MNGSITVANVLCSVGEGEFSYQEYNRQGKIIYNYAIGLSGLERIRLLPYIISANFKPCASNEVNWRKAKLIGYRDEISIIFRAISQDGRPLLIYNMSAVYRDWFNYPTDKLYDYLVKRFFHLRSIREYLLHKDYLFRFVRIRGCLQKSRNHDF